MDDYDRFVDRWPDLQDWFDAPLRQRLLDKENCLRGEHPHGGAAAVMPYLTYLSLVERVGLDYPVLLARTFTSPFKHQMRYGGLGVDVELFDRHMARLEQLGYARGATQLTWPLGRMLLHHADPDLTALGLDDLVEFRRRSMRSPRGYGLSRCASSTPALLMLVRPSRSPRDTSLPRSPNCTPYTCCCSIGQLQEPPAGRVNAVMGRSLAPELAPLKVGAVVERYLRLHLQADLHRPQSLRHMRDALPAGDLDGPGSPGDEQPG
jgi:hypothetical protein